MTNSTNNAIRQFERRQNLSMNQYVQYRNGVHLGHRKSLGNMLYRSFGASSFAGFWQYWNPIWGYGLRKFIYRPLRQIIPPVIAYMFTLIVSGFIHDLVIMAIRRSFTLLFTPWFILLGAVAVFGRVIYMDLSNHPWWIRAGTNLIYLMTSFFLIFFIKQIGLIA